MSDELQDAEHRANRLYEQVESLRGQNTELADCVTHLRAARTKLQQQRDQLLIPAREIAAMYPRIIPPHMINALRAAAQNCVPVAETVDAIAAAVQYGVSRLDAALERAHDESDYDTAVAVRDAARSLNSACGITDMEASAMIAELDQLAARGGPQDDVDDPAYKQPDSGSDTTLLSVGPDILNRNRKAR